MNVVEKEISIIKEHCDKLKLGDKAGISAMDLKNLQNSLKEAGHFRIALDLQKRFQHPEEFEDFMVNTIYDGCEEEDEED